MEEKDSKPAGKKRLRDMTKDEILKLSPDEFKKAFDENRLFTVRDAIEWLSKQNPNAGLMYFEENSNAWCDMSPDMFRTAAEEKKYELEMLQRWHRDSPEDASSKIKKEMKEIFRYVKDDDICVRQ